MLPALPLALSSFRLLLFKEPSIVGLLAGRMSLPCTDDSVVVAVAAVEGLLIAPLYMLRYVVPVEVVSIAWSNGEWGQ